MFGVEGKVAIVTGATGVLGGAMARGLARAGVKVAVLGRRRERAEQVANEIIEAGGTALATPADVLDKAELEAVRDQVLAAWGNIDILVNAAGGTTPAATIPPDRNFFQMDVDATRYVIDLNLVGTLLPSYVFGEVMAKKKQGCVVNISSMNAQRAFTRSIAYSAGKSATDSFTRSLAIELATKFGEGLRVNAIAPGFFVGDQNRALLLNPDDTLTSRGQKIIDHTPFGRFGEPDDLVGTLLWLCSPAASFVTGTITMVDGGANAFSGI
ncbi:MAG: SDR family oxidoreductase [Anaerolineae bacterium]|nr:SDR family oxidoreductase [Anaerolineae bacterium]